MTNHGVYRAIFALLSAGLAACSGGSSEDGLDATGGGGSSGAASTEAVIRVHLTSSTAPVPQTDGLSGQTPLTYVTGIRSYKLLRSMADPSPATVFDLGKGFVEASYADGADTLLATVPLASIPEGKYAFARVVHTHNRYRVKATLHDTTTLVGEFDDVFVLSNDTTLDGVVHAQGDYTYTFLYAGTKTPTSGTNGILPESTTMGGFTVVNEGGEWAYYFPVDMVIDHGPKDRDTYLRVNVFEAFRWQDEAKPGYLPGVFDVTASGYEPVKRFGANSFAVEVK